MRTNPLSPPGNPNIIIMPLSHMFALSTFIRYLLTPNIPVDIPAVATMHIDTDTATANITDMPAPSSGGRNKKNSVQYKIKSKNKRYKSRKYKGRNRNRSRRINTGRKRQII